MSEEVVNEKLQEMDSEIESFENENLGWFARMRRRYWNAKVILAWNISSGVTVGQMLGGKWLLTWFASKLSLINAVAAKLWAAFITTVLGLWHMFLG